MSYSIFTFINEICYKKSDLDFNDPTIFKEYNIYMINRYLSMNPNFIGIVQDVNKTKITKKAHYLFLKALIPKNNYYFDYIKTKKDKDSDRSKKIICVANYFEVGLKEAEQYYDSMDEESLKEILKIYTCGKDGKTFILK